MWITTYDGNACNLEKAERLIVNYGLKNNDGSRDFIVTAVFQGGIESNNTMDIDRYPTKKQAELQITQLVTALKVIEEQ